MTNYDAAMDLSNKPLRHRQRLVNITYMTAN